MDLNVKADIVNYDKHGIKRPKIWNRPVAKVYDCTQKTTNIMYQPMMRYIDRKDVTKSYSGFENTPHVRSAAALERTLVDLPSADELYSISKEPEEYYGPLRLNQFLVSAKAAQSKQRTKQTVHVMNQWYRNSKDADSLRWPRTSTSVRDKYILELSTMYATGTGKMANIMPTTNGPWSRFH